MYRVQLFANQTVNSGAAALKTELLFLQETGGKTNGLNDAIRNI